MLRCTDELNEWNSSGGYCVTIPYHHGERRELRPDELLKIVAGVEVPGACQQPQHNSAAPFDGAGARRRRGGSGAGAGAWRR